jgi:hypothetical protein
VYRAVLGLARWQVREKLGARIFLETPRTGFAIYFPLRISYVVDFREDFLVLHRA